MNRFVSTTVGLAASLVLAGFAEAQERATAHARQSHNFVEYGVPDTGYVPNAYYANPAVALPPNAYARRATPGGLVETAARRMNPFAAPSRAWDVSFVPSAYRQPPPSYRVARPGFDVYGPGSGHGTGRGPAYYHSAAPHAGAGHAPTSGMVPGVNCPTCPR